MRVYLVFDSINLFDFKIHTGFLQQLIHTKYTKSYGLHKTKDITINRRTKTNHYVYVFATDFQFFHLIL